MKTLLFLILFTGIPYVPPRVKHKKKEYIWTPGNYPIKIIGDSTTVHPRYPDRVIIWNDGKEVGSVDKFYLK